MMLNASNKIKQSMNNQINKNKKEISEQKGSMKVIPLNDVFLPATSKRDLELEKKYRMGNARYHRYRYFKSRKKQKSDAQGREVPYASESVGLSVKKQIGDLVKSMEKVNLKTDFIKGKKNLNSLLSHLERKIDRAHDHNIEHKRAIKEECLTWDNSPKNTYKKNQHKKLYDVQGGEELEDKPLCDIEQDFYSTYGKSYFNKFISNISTTTELACKKCYDVPYENIKKLAVKCAELSIKKLTPEEQEMDHIASFLEDLLIGFINVAYNRNLVSFVVSTLTIIKSISRKALINTNVQDLALNMFKLYISAEKQGMYYLKKYISKCPTWEDLLNYLHTYFDAPVTQGEYGDWMDTELFRMVTGWFAYLCYVVVSPKAIKDMPFLGDLLQSMRKEGKEKSQTILRYAINSVEWIITKGRQWNELGFKTTFYHSKNTYIEIVKRYDQAVIDFEKMGNPEIYGLDIWEFHTRLQDLYRDLHEIVKAVPQKDKLAVQKVFTHVVQMFNRLNSKDEIMKERIAPFALLFWGNTSVAKSQFLDLSWITLCRILSLKAEPKFKYTANNDERLDGFQTHMHTMVLDDVGNMKDSFCPNGDKKVMNIIDIKNNVPYITEQAVAELKGQIPLKIKLLLMTANTDHINAGVYLNYPAAIYRRIEYYVHLELKPQYMENGMFNPDQAVASDVLADYWIITVTRKVPRTNDNKQVHDLPVMRFEHFEDYAIWLAKEAKRHFANQAKRSEASLGFRNFKICHSGHFHFQKDCDDCVEMVTRVCKSDHLHESVLEVTRCDQKFIENNAKIAQAGNEESTILDEVQSTQSRAVDEAIPESFLLRSLVAVESISKLFEGSGWSLMLPFLIICVIVLYFLYFIVWLSNRLHMKLREYLGNIANQCIFYIVQKSIDKEMERRLKPSQKVVIKLQSLIDRFSLMGDAVCPPKWNRLMTVVSLFSTSAAIYGTYKYFKSKQSGITCERVITIKKDPIRFDEYGDTEQTTLTYKSVQGGANSRHAEFWVDNANVITQHDVASSSLYYKNNLEEMINNVSHNIILIRATLVSGKIIWIRAFCLGGYCYVSLYHYFKDKDIKEYFFIQDASVGASANFTVEAQAINLLPYESLDFVFFYLKHNRPKKRMSNLLAKGNLDGLVCDGFYIQRNQNGSMSRIEVQNIRNSTIDIQFRDGQIREQVPVFTGIVDSPTQVGDCASPLFGLTEQGPVLLGLHISGQDKLCHAYKFPKEYLERFNIDDGPTLAPIKLVYDSKQRTLIPERSVSHATFLPATSSLYRFGSIQGGGARATSRVENSILHDAFVRRGYVPIKGRPKLNDWRIFRNATDKLTERIARVNISIMEEIRDETIAYYCRVIPLTEFNDLGILEDSVNVNGMPGVDFIDKINRNTSAGFPWCDSKKKFLIPFSTPDHPDGMIFTNEIWDEFKRIDYLARCGIMSQMIVNAAQKDEPLSFKKIMECKTRLFMGSPLPYVLLDRKYFLPIIRMMQRCHKVTGVSVGLVVQSIQWEELRLSFPWIDRMLAGDYGSFDKTLFAQILLNAFEIMIGLAKYSGGYNEEDLTAMHSIAADIVFALVHFDGDLLCFLGSLPSGIIMTVIINCICNKSLHIYAFVLRSLPDGFSDDVVSEEISLSEKPITRVTALIRVFNKHVVSTFYGDDSLLSVSPRITWFNHITISEELAKIGIIYTMADKQATLIPFYNIDEVTYLKRRFVYDSEQRIWLAPMEPENIISSLMVWVKSKSLKSQEQAYTMLVTSIREWFFHGRHKYDEMVRIYKEIYLEVTNQELILPEYNDVLEDYKLLSESAKRSEIYFAQGGSDDDSYENQMLETFQIEPCFKRLKLEIECERRLLYAIRQLPTELILLIREYYTELCRICGDFVCINKLCFIHFSLFQSMLVGKISDPRCWCEFCGLELSVSFTCFRAPSLCYSCYGLLFCPVCTIFIVQKRKYYTICSIHQRVQKVRHCVPQLFYEGSFLTRPITNVGDKRRLFRSIISRYLPHSA